MPPDPVTPDSPGPDRLVDLLGAAVEALGGQRREGQVEMVRAVGRALISGQALLIQAGTGTGKSLGYLVPAIDYAVRLEQRVVVSTATLALQRQVVGRDLPVVAEALAPSLPRRPNVALLKGWQNYVCVHKLAGGYPSDDTLFDAVGADSDIESSGESATGLGAQVVRVRQWAQDTSTGDRDDLVPGVTERAWRQVSVTSRECLGRRCPMIDECFAAQARDLARSADVVVTNHAMLAVVAAGAAAVLPDHQVLIVDEAHELASRVTAQATDELSGAMVDQVARTVRRMAATPTTDLDSAAQGLAAALLVTEEGRLVNGLPDQLADAVTAVRDAARALLSAVRSTDTAMVTIEQPEGGRQIAIGSLQSLFETSERLVGDPETLANTVVWCERATDRPGVPISRLRAAPLAVDGLIRTQLLQGRAAVLTSATLALGGSFDAAARSVGLPVSGAGSAVSATASDLMAEQGTPEDHGASMPWWGMDVGSPFDYRNQGICYIAAHLPKPGREPATDAQLDEIEALIRAAGGRTLGLFSSRRAAGAAAEAMRERLSVPVLLQGDDQLPTLVNQFAQDPATCLFGTLSLWQGVDVPGATCRLVLIDRIPFPRPDDPVAAARTAAVSRTGGNGFMAVSAAHAALLLAQGSGRLIRSDQDRGVVAVLDPRLATARYGEYLDRSMPPFWRTTDRQVAVGALHRLAAADV